MNTKQGFQLRYVCGEYFIICENDENIDVTTIISMNESAAYLWKKVVGTTFTTDDMARLLCEEYEVDEATAKRDAEQTAKEWRDAGLIEADSSI